MHRSAEHSHLNVIALVVHFATTFHSPLASEFTDMQINYFSSIISHDDDDDDDDECMMVNRIYFI
jgi:hypothetical protein